LHWDTLVSTGKGNKATSKRGLCHYLTFRCMWL
jgi:hypothetical protein